MRNRQGVIADRHERIQKKATEFTPADSQRLKFSARTSCQVCAPAWLRAESHADIPAAPASCGQAVAWLSL